MQARICVLKRTLQRYRPVELPLQQPTNHAYNPSHNYLEEFFGAQRAYQSITKDVDELRRLTTAVAMEALQLERIVL